MTQPAVSNHLHALEERFGVRLLTRGRGLRATPAGECLTEHARRVKAELSALESDMVRHAGPRGRLIVGASSTPGELLIPKLAVEYSARYPDVALEVRVDDTEKIVAALVRRDIEVAVLGREVDDPRLVGTLIEQDALIPVVAARDRLARSEIAPEELADRPFVLRKLGSAARLAVEKGLAAAGLGPRVAMELGSNAAIAGAVAAGAGVGVVPARTVASQPGIEPIKVRGLAFSRPFVLVREDDRELSPAAEAFAAICIGEGNA